MPLFSAFSGISRADQDAYAIGSYEKSKAAVEGGVFDAELCPVTIPGKRGKPDVVVGVDEEFNKVNFRLVFVILSYHYPVKKVLSSRVLTVIAEYICLHRH